MQSGLSPQLREMREQGGHFPLSPYALYGSLTFLYICVLFFGRNVEEDLCPKVLLKERREQDRDRETRAGGWPLPLSLYALYVCLYLSLYVFCCCLDM